MVVASIPTNNNPIDNTKGRILEISLSRPPIYPKGTLTSITVVCSNAMIPERSDGSTWIATRDSLSVCKTAPPKASNNKETVNITYPHTPVSDMEIKRRQPMIELIKPPYKGHFNLD